MAIAYDNSASGSAFRASVNTVSWSHTIGGGSNRVVVAACGGIGNAAMTVTGVTFNGVAMTAIDTSITIATNRPVGWFYLPESSLPTAGTYSVVATFSTSNTDVIRGGSISFSGASQSSIPSTKNPNFTGSSVSSLTTNVTVTPSNCWLVGFAESQANESSITGGTLRSQSNANEDGQFSVYDSNGVVGTGTQGMTVGISSATYIGFFVAAIAPVAGSTGLVPRKQLLGVGK